MDKTDVIMVSNGNRGLIYRSLESVQKWVGERLGSVCLAWNGDEQELKKVEKFANMLGIELKVENTPYHFSKNNNCLVKKHAKSKNLLFLNDDVELKDNFVEDASSLLEKPQVGFVGSKLVRPDNKIQHAGVIAFVNSCGGLVAPAHYMYGQDNTSVPDYTPFAVTGACMMCRRETFLKLGCFNEQYDEGFQDFEVCAKAVCANLTNVCLNESHCQLHDESATRDPKVLPHDSDILASFWRGSIPKMMRSQSPSCVGIIERAEVAK